MRPSRLLASLARVVACGTAATTILTSCQDAPAAHATLQGSARFDGIYGDSLLAYWGSRYEPNIRYNFERLLLPVLTAAERRATRSLNLQLLLRDRRDPLAYYVASPPPTIIVSAFSIKFLDDLMIAAAWLERHDYSIESVTYYADVLKYRDVSDMPDGFSPPLRAMRIPSNALEDSTVDFLSQEMLKGTIVFTLAHEIGHVVGNHTADATMAERQRQETEADLFATTIFRRMGLAPVSIVPFFLIAAHLQHHRGDFASDAAWSAWYRTHASHPLSGVRLHALAAELRRSPEEFATRLPNRSRAVQRIREAAAQIDSMASLVDDPLRLRHAAAVGRQIPLSELRPRRRGHTWIPQRQ
jgi:hypothetical protein